MKANLTHAFVEAVKSPAGGQLDYWDAKTPGFGLRVSQGGSKTWLVRYYQNDHKRRLGLGRWPGMSLADARTAARRYLGQVANGNDPAVAKAEAKREPTFEELAALYLEHHAAQHKKPRSAAEDARMLRSDVAVWNERKLSAIKRADVIALLDEIVTRGAAIQANRVRALISKMFNFAIGRALIEHNPAHQIPRPTAERSRDRVLSADEIRALWLAVKDEPPKVSSLFKLAFLTAARRTEILGMRWDEIDFAGGWWTIPASRSKNGLAHRIPLVGGALETLRTLEAQPPQEREYVFNGGRLGQPVANPQKWLQRIREGTSIEDFRLHDIRRSVASNLTALGVPRLTVSKLLNHVETSITAVYDRHSYDAEKRVALVRWERRLREIVALRQETGKIVALR
jgi:integrase